MRGFQKRLKRFELLGVLLASSIFFYACATAMEVYVPFPDSWEGVMVDVGDDDIVLDLKLCEPDQTGNKCVIMFVTTYEKKKRRLADLEEKCGGG